MTLDATVESKTRLFRLYNACGEYHGYLQKKKEYSSVEEGVKMLPVDALGAVMMSHGEEFGPDSAFGVLLLFWIRFRQLLLMPRRPRSAQSRPRAL